MSLRIAAAAVLAVSIAAGQAPQTQRGRTQQQPAETPDNNELKPVPGLAASVDPNAYKIGAEDVIKVTVWKEEQLGTPGVAVRPDGMITLPLIGEVRAAESTPAELSAVLKEKYGELVNNPLVGVEVLMVRSKKYYITGQGAGRAGAFPLVVPTRVLEAITMSGGVTEWANKKKIVIMRGDKRYYFNFDAAVKGKLKGDKFSEQNIYLENGDFIIIN